MDIQGQVIAVSDVRKGVSSKGEWQSMSFVIQTSDRYPKKVCFNLFGAERIAKADIHEGDNLLVKFDIDAKEFNGKWYNDVNAYDVTKIESTGTGGAKTESQPQQPQAPFQPQQEHISAPEAVFGSQEKEDDDKLPF